MLLLALAVTAWPSGSPVQAEYESRQILQWRVQISRDLLAQQPGATEKALVLLEGQLKEIVAKVPPPAVAKLRKVTLWMSPEYPNTPPRAEYHPGAQWLRDNGRNPEMAKAVEFTNVRIFEAETRRMPNFALHELAHAYHDQHLPQGHRNPEILAEYERAKASGTYDRVERRDAEGRTFLGKAYAMSNPAEYFAETTEAYFSTNDFFPYHRAQLKLHDPRMYRLLGKLWRTVDGPSLKPVAVP